MSTRPHADLSPVTQGTPPDGSAREVVFEPTAEKPTRQTGRVKFDGLRCDLGRVIDMSAKGIGLISRHSLHDRVGEMIGFRVSAKWCKPFVLGGEIRWSRRVGFMKHHIGIAFVNLSDKQHRRLNDLARGIGSREYGWSKL